MKKLLCGLIIMICMMQLAVASLEIVDADAIVNGDKESARAGGSVDVEPGDTFKLKLEIRNNGDLEVENIEIEGAIFSIDDEGDDDNEADEPSEFDLKSGKKKKATIDFDDIPLLVEDGDYDLELTIEGTDTNNSLVTTTFNMTVTVEKDNHKLLINSATLSPNTIECGQSTELDVTVINIGEEDEDEIQLKVSSSDLDFEQTSEFDLQSGDDPDEVRESKRYRITAGEDVEPGNYPINIRATFDEGDEVVEQTVDLIVTECTVEETTIEETQTPQQTQEQTTVTTTQAPTAEELLAQVRGEAPEVEETQESSFLDQYAVALVVLLYLVVIAVGAIVFAAILKSRK